MLCSPYLGDPFADGFLVNNVSEFLGGNIIIAGCWAPLRLSRLNFAMDAPVAALLSRGSECRGDRRRGTRMGRGDQVIGNVCYSSLYGEPLISRNLLGHGRRWGFGGAKYDVFGRDFTNSGKDSV